MDRVAQSPCPTDDELAAWTAGQLPEEAKEELARHFRECLACASLATQYAKTSALKSTTGSDSSAGPEPGYRLGAGAIMERYVLLYPVGSGGMGEVYAAHDTKLNRKVALKLLRKDPDPLSGARLLREARAMAKLTHPNVVTVYEAGTAADRAFVAMEFVEGTSLATWLRSHRSLSEILSVFRQAGRGLAAAHAANLIHRDFKPANVLLGKDGRVRVTDFGLARPAGNEPAGSQSDGALVVSETLTQTGAILGTPAYMAPEQFEGRTVSARSDQFSFCVALYEALYSVRPFSGQNTPEIWHRILTGNINPPLAARAPNWIRNVLLRGLRAAPEERYSSMDALLTALDKDPAIVRRRRLSWAAVAAGMAVLVGFAIFAFMRGEGARQPSSAERAHQSISVEGARLPSGSESVRRHISVMVAFSPGGATDFQARIATMMAGDKKYLGQPVVIVNKPGAGGQVGWTWLVQDADSDGYTLAAYNIPHLIAQSIMFDTKYNIDNLEPIANWGADPAVLIVREDSRFNTAQDLIDFARANPGKITVSGAGLYVGHHIAMLQLEKAAGIRLSFVPAMGGVNALQYVVGGQSAAGFNNLSDAYRSRDRLRILAVADLQRNQEFFPEVPTFIELGIDVDDSSVNFRGLMAPKGTPEEALVLLADRVPKLFQDPKVIKKMHEGGSPMRVLTRTQVQRMWREREHYLKGLLKGLEKWQDLNGE